MMRMRVKVMLLVLEVLKRRKKKKKRRRRMNKNNIVFHLISDIRISQSLKYKLTYIRLMIQRERLSISAAALIVLLIL